ncbi:uncharacterized protein LOC131508527 [Neofelis nebulosa]|uniref:uncharacterized protein LOC131508527 n=1 Tax=Neofelis nebulosa TaxID=61452 RepID=UPI00272BBECF|nr:uncharacterized protein LOC131508527 [Neofelis nebulosa]
MPATAAARGCAAGALWNLGNPSSSCSSDAHTEPTASSRGARSHLALGAWSASWRPKEPRFAGDPWTFDSARKDTGVCSTEEAVCVESRLPEAVGRGGNAGLRDTPAGFFCSKQGWLQRTVRPGGSAGPRGTRERKAPFSATSLTLEPRTQRPRSSKRHRACLRFYVTVVLLNGSSAQYLLSSGLRGGITWERIRFASCKNSANSEPEIERKEPPVEYLRSLRALCSPAADIRSLSPTWPSWVTDEQPAGAPFPELLS